MFCSNCGCQTDSLQDSILTNQSVCANCADDHIRTVQYEEEMANSNVMDFPGEEESEQTEEEFMQNIRCVVTVAVTQDGQPIININGTMPDLFTAEGLLDYGKRYIQKLWKNQENRPSEEEAVGPKRV